MTSINALCTKLGLNSKSINALYSNVYPSVSSDKSLLALAPVTVANSFPTELITDTLPQTLTLDLSENKPYVLNIAGFSGPQSPYDTIYTDVKGIDINVNSQPTITIKDTAYQTRASTLTFYGNKDSEVYQSSERSMNSEFHSRYKPPGGYIMFTASNPFQSADVVVSWYIPLPASVYEVSVDYTRNSPWYGFSITI